VSGSDRTRRRCCGSPRGQTQARAGPTACASSRSACTSRKALRAARRASGWWLGHERAGSRTSHRSIAEPRVVTTARRCGSSARSADEARREQTAGRFGLGKACSRTGGAPPCTPPQDETFMCRRGSPSARRARARRRCTRGPSGLGQHPRPAAAPSAQSRSRRRRAEYVPRRERTPPHAGPLHARRVEDMVRALAEPRSGMAATTPRRPARTDRPGWASVERETGMVRHGPPPQPTSQPGSHGLIAELPGGSGRFLSIGPPTRLLLVSGICASVHCSPSATAPPRAWRIDSWRRGRSIRMPC